MGAIDIGYPIASSVIQATLECQFGAEYVIIDSPPGASCPMVSAVKDADFVMLVTEPTAFGLHDLKIAVDVVTKLNIPFGVILNKSDSGDDRVNHFCSLKSIPILLEIKEERRIAELYSNGLTLIDALPEYKQKLIDLIEKLQI
ncbi:MAG TPA: hypothetical protein P5105_01545 [Victivallales bacterium]|nr:hypothetical protein [Victivallales bacterium]